MHMISCRPASIGHVWLTTSLFVGFWSCPKYFKGSIPIWNQVGTFFCTSDNDNFPRAQLFTHLYSIIYIVFVYGVFFQKFTFICVSVTGIPSNGYCRVQSIILQCPDPRHRNEESTWPAMGHTLRIEMTSVELWVTRWYLILSMSTQVGTVNYKRDVFIPLTGTNTESDIECR